MALDSVLWYYWTLVFTKEGVNERLQTEEIKISFDLDPRAASATLWPESKFVDPKEVDADLYKFYSAAFFGDRLGLHLGPIVRSHTYAKLSGRVQFKHQDYHFDLRATNNQFEIMPGESVTVNTLEYIALKGTVAATILPRLTLATSGLEVIPSYIDPWWQGILQLCITNVSAFPHTLTIGEKIAVCRFYEVTPPASNNTDAFAVKSHHYGHNWRRVLTTDEVTNPIRKKAIPLKARVFNLKIALTNALAQVNVIFGATFGVLAIGAIVSWASFQSKAERLDDLTKAQQDLSNTQKSQSDAIRTLTENSVMAGRQTIDLSPGSTTGSITITLPRKVRNDSDVWVSLNNESTASVKAFLHQDKSLTDQLTIVVTRPNGSPPLPLNLGLKWIVAPH